jgi:hypothetical protein
VKKLARHDDFIAVPAFMGARLVAETAGQENETEGQQQEGRISPRGAEIRRHRSGAERLVRQDGDFRDGENESD